MARTARAPGTVEDDLSAADSEDLVHYCARPNCRKEFRKATGPGRRRAYCSDVCRRLAEKEQRRLQARLARFEALADQARADIAAHGREDDAAPPDPMRAAEDALARVEGALIFAGQSPNPAAQELRRLYEAVAPVIRHRV